MLKSIAQLRSIALIGLLTSSFARMASAEDEAGGEGSVATTSTSAQGEAFAGAAPPAREEQSGGLFVDSVRASFGYAWTQQQRTDVNGGVPELPGPDHHGWAANVAVYLAPSALPELKPFIDFNRRNYSDRNFTTAALGAVYDFWLTESFNLHVGPGVSYNFLHWEEPPIPGVTGVGGAEGIGVLGKFGLSWFFSDHVGIGIDGRAEFYGLDSVFVEGAGSRTLNDNASVSVLGGLVFRFNRPNYKKCATCGACAACPTCPEGGAVGTKPDGDEDADGVLNGRDRCPGTLEGIPVKTDGCPLDDFTFQLEFEYERFTVSSIVGRPDFKVVAFLLKHKNYKVEIVGYTDDVGSEEFNQKLGSRRAKAAREFLVDRGVDEARVAVATAGSSHPAYQNDSEGSRAANRRIVVRFYNPQSAQAEIQDGDVLSDKDPIKSEPGAPVPADEKASEEKK